MKSEVDDSGLDDLIVSPEQSLLEALQVIDRGHLEVALLCDDQRKLLGVITDGDARRALISGKGLEHPAADIACRECVTAGVDMDRQQATRIMLKRQINCIPVVDDNGVLVDVHTLYASLRVQHCASWAVIMAGGFGTRLGELTSALPKPMLPIGDRPILQHIVEHVVSHGIERLFLSVSYLGTMIEDYFGDGSQFNCRIEYLREDEPLGTAGPLSLLPQPVAQPVLVMNGDLLTRINITRLLAYHRAGGFAATMAVRNHKVQVPFGVAEIDGVRIAKLVEKPSLSYHINAGIYVLDPEVVASVPAQQLMPMTQVFDNYLHDPRGIGAYHMQEEWQDIGLPDEFARAQGGG